VQRPFRQLSLILKVRLPVCDYRGKLISMPKKQSDDATELLRDMLIVQLGLAGVGRENIRKIARCDNNRVATVLRLLKSGKKPKQKP